MNPSLFIQFIEKFFLTVVGKITEVWNDQKNEQVLLHKTMLVEEYSPNLSWGSTELSHSIVAADVVALDSSIPLKSRDKISIASGKLTKLAVKYRKGESDITEINTMIARGADEATIASRIFDDASRVIKAIDVRTEVMFLQALSTGTLLTEDDTNTGTGVRADYGYLKENTFHATTAAWGESGYTPVTDVQQLFTAAERDSNVIRHIYMSRKYFNLFRNSAEGKLLAASFLKQVVTDQSLLPVPSRATFLDALRDEFGAEFHVVEGTFRIEKKDGTKTTVNPWAEANIIGTPDMVVGRLVYSTLAEETNPVANVEYAKSGSHILVSKYSKTDPLEEFTSGQALCIPVIDGGNSIYMLHADSMGSLTVVPSSLTFAKTAGSDKFKVHFDGKLSDLTIASTETWATVTRSKDVVTVTVTANSGAERTASVTVTDGTTTKTVSITQATGL